MATKKPPKRTPAKAKAQPVGRPSLYRDEYCQRLVEFFSIGLTRTEIIKAEEGEQLIEKANLFPTLTRFAATLGVTRQTLWEWANEKNEDGTLKHPQFFDAYARARDLQESLLIEGGMSGTYQHSFAQLAAKNLIGWRDKTDIEASHSVVAATVEQLDAFYQDQIAKGRTLDAMAEGRADRIPELSGGNG